MFTMWSLLRVAPLASILAASNAMAAWLPDPPMRTRVVRGADGSEITCIYYRDLMVRVPQTDTPSPGNAMLVRADRHTPPCTTTDAGSTALKTQGASYLGRSGAYLFFEEADPNGPIGFSVIDARTGRIIVKDSTQGGIAARYSMQVSLAVPDALTLSYRRAVDLNCSILTVPAACWSRYTRNEANAVPTIIARLPPPERACRRRYALIKADRATSASFPIAFACH